MILFLSKAFQQQLRLVWRPDLKAFLVGERNLFFFVPETIIEAPEISSPAIDAFLKRGEPGGSWQLLALLSPEEQPPLPGYAQIFTGGNRVPHSWTARVYLLSGNEIEARTLEIKTSD